MRILTTDKWRLIASLTPSSEAATMPAENTQSIQPSVFWRATSLSGLSISGALATGVGATWDVIGLIGTNATPHRNGIANGNFLTGDAWGGTNCQPTLAAATYSGILPGSTGVLPWLLTASGSGAFISQAVNKPDSVAYRVQYALYFMDSPSATAAHGRIYFEGASSSHNVTVDVDLSDGSINTASDAGDFTLHSSTSTEDSVSGLYRVLIDFTMDAASTLTHRIYVLTSSFTTATTSQEIIAGGAYLDWSGDASVDVLVADYLDESTASMWRIIADPTNPLITPTFDTGYMPLCPVLDATGTDSISSWHLIETPRYEDEFLIEFFDPDNTDGYFDVGRILVGQSVAIPGNLVAYTPDVEEQGGEARTRGGQRYRGQHPRTRVAEFTLEYLTRAQAYGEIMQMYRTLGRSTPGLFIADETETTYLDEFSVYGFLDGTHPIPRQRGDFWQTRFRVVEVV